MDAQQFAYWLQGFAELHAEAPTPEQWQSIREHLALVFNKVTPPVELKEPSPTGDDPDRAARWVRDAIRRIQWPPDDRDGPMIARCSTEPLRIC